MDHAKKASEFIGEGYKIHVTGRHIEVSDMMRDYVVDKLSKIERITDRIIEINVIMEVQKLDQSVEIVMQVGSHKIMSNASSSDMYVSIDMAIKKLESQLLHYKSKVQDHRK